MKDEYSIPKWLVDKIAQKMQEVQFAVEDLPTPAFIQATTLIGDLAQLKGYIDGAIRLNIKEVEKGMTAKEEDAMWEDIMDNMHKEEM